MKTSPRAYSNLTTYYRSDISRHDRRRDEKRSRRYCSIRRYHSTTLTACKRDLSESGLEVVVPVSKRYLKAVDYHSYRLTHRSQQHEDDMHSKIQYMRRKLAV